MGCGSQDSESDRLRSQVLDADFRCLARFTHANCIELSLSGVTRRAYAHAEFF